MPEPPFSPSPSRTGPPIEGDDLSRLLAAALGLPKAATHKSGLSRESFSVVAERLVEYLRDGGYTVLRPPAMPMHGHPAALRKPHRTD